MRAKEDEIFYAFIVFRFLHIFLHYICRFLLPLQAILALNNKKEEPMDEIQPSASHITTAK